MYNTCCVHVLCNTNVLNNNFTTCQTHIQYLCTCVIRRPSIFFKGSWYYAKHTKHELGNTGTHVNTMYVTNLNCRAHGRHMVNIWWAHGGHMVNIWWAHGEHMVDIWLTNLYIPNTYGSILMSTNQQCLFFIESEWCNWTTVTTWWWHHSDVINFNIVSDSRIF